MTESQSETESTPETPELRMFPEFRCWPLWWTDAAGDLHNQDPHDFGLSPDLAQALDGWSAGYDDLFDEQDFSRPLFDTPGAERSFADQGLALATRLADELRGRFAVRFHAKSSDAWVQLG